VQIAAVNILPEQFLAGWQPETGRLFLPTLSDAQLGELVAIRVGLTGQELRATLFGVVALVRRIGRPSLPPGVDLQLEIDSRRTAGWLAAAARGEEVTFRERPPRFVAERALLAVRERITVPVLTLNLSESGCSLRWTGPLPDPGEAIGLRVGEGLLAAAPRGIVAWTAVAKLGQGRVGIRISASGRAERVWARLAAEAARSGAVL
jgi:hypothetical protein